MERQRLLEVGQTAEAAALAQTGTDRVLVILVEFAGTDVFTWTAPITPMDPTTGSQWDPLGIADPNEAVLTRSQSCLATARTSSPRPRPLPTPARCTIRSSGRCRPPIDRVTRIWTPDFNKQWFTDFMFGNGVVIQLHPPG